MSGLPREGLDSVRSRLSCQRMPQLLQNLTFHVVSGRLA